MATDLTSAPTRQHVLGPDAYDLAVARLAELQGIRNAVDAELIDLLHEMCATKAWMGPGCHTLEHFLRWIVGASPANARMLAAIARRLDDFPECVAQFRGGELSTDQLGAIAQHARDGSDRHYAQFASAMTVTQLRTAARLDRLPDDHEDSDTSPSAEDDGEPRHVHRIETERGTRWDIALGPTESAVFDAALASHHDALVAAWRRDHAGGESDTAPPFPTRTDSFMALVEAGWDSDAVRRPHGHRTTVVLHVDADRLAAGLPNATLHLGPAMSTADRQFLTCDARFELWLERNGVPFAHGRTTREIPRRLRRALEHRDRSCIVPGCESTRGLHAHHLTHWEHGGSTDLDNLALVCPAHHRMHHRGEIVIGGTGGHPTVTDSDGVPLPRGPAIVAPDPDELERRRQRSSRYRGAAGERADWWMYSPFQARPPSEN